MVFIHLTYELILESNHNLYKPRVQIKQVTVLNASKPNQWKP